jgi:hypothetical protein
MSIFYLSYAVKPSERIISRKKSIKASKAAQLPDDGEKALGVRISGATGAFSPMELSMRVKVVLYLGGLFLACQGCCPLARSGRTSIVEPLMYPRYVNDWIDCSRNRKLAQSAWAEFVSCVPAAYSKDFEKGFKEGFTDYLFWGGTGAPPPVPPRCYWNAKYQNPEGHKAIDDWFAGFRKGAERARESGSRKLVVVPASAVLPSMLPETSSAPALPAPAGPGPSLGPGAGLEEALPPPRPVPVPETLPPAVPPQTGPQLPEARGGRPQGAVPVPDEASRAPSRSVEDLLAPQTLAKPAARPNGPPASGEVNGEKAPLGQISAE